MSGRTVALSTFHLEPPLHAVAAGMSVDIKVSYEGSTRRLRAPLVPIPSAASLISLATTRYGLTGSYHFAYVDEDGDRIVFSTDEEVEELWPRKPADMTAEAFTDSLAPLKFDLVEASPASAEPALAPVADESSFSVPDATGEPSAPAEAEPPLTAAANDAEDPPDAELLPELDDIPPVNQDSPIIAITRGIVDMLESTLNRTPLERGVKDAAMGILGSVAAIGMNVDQLVSYASSAGEGFCNALREERARRQAEEAARFQSASPTASSGRESTAMPPL